MSIGADLLFQLKVCGTCFGLRGETSDRRQLCSCASSEDSQAYAEECYRRNGSYWTTVAVICRCCGAEVVDAGYKFSRWYCARCIKTVHEVNEACGFCAIPVGWHSIVNGVYVSPKSCRTEVGATAVADQLNAFFRESGGAWGWGKQVTERQWKRAGLPLDQHVAANDYLTAVWMKRVDKRTLFEELAAARGIPAEYWPKSEMIKLNLTWREDYDSCSLFHAVEKILWERPSTDDEYTDLLLRAERAADRHWRWTAGIDPEAAAPHYRLLADGVAPSLDQAKEDCEAAACRLILDQEERLGPFLTPLTPAAPGDSSYLG